MLVEFPGVVFPDILRQVGNSARISMNLPRNSGFSPRFLEHLARVVRVSDKETSPAVAFEVYRVRVKSESEPAAEDERRNPLLIQ